MDFLLLAPFLVLVLSILFSTLGLGGASIYVPIFYWMGLPLESAIVCGLFINVLTTGVSSYVFHKNGLLTTIDYKAAAFIFAGAFLGAPIGVWVAQLLPSSYLLGLFALVLMLAAVRMYTYKGHVPKLKEASMKKEAPQIDAQAGFMEEAGGQAVGVALRRAALSGAAETGTLAIGRSVTMGGGTGMLSGTLGIGGGVFLVPFLIDSGVHPRRSAILSHVCTLLASFVGLVGHLLIGAAVNLPFLLTTGAAAVIGSAIGSHLLSVGKISSAQIKGAFVVLLVLVAFKLGLDALGLGGAPAIMYD